MLLTHFQLIKPIFSSQPVQIWNKLSKIGIRHYCADNSDSGTPPIQDPRWKTLFKNLEDWNRSPPLTHTKIKFGQKLYKLEKKNDYLTEISCEIKKENKVLTDAIQHIASDLRYLKELKKKRY